MRKIFKKIITAVASAAMLAGLVAGVPSMEAKAATDVKLYVNVDDPESYGVNVWGGSSAVTGGEDVMCWGTQPKPSLIPGTGDKAGWGYVTLNDSSETQGIQFVKGSDVLNGNVWNATIASLGLTEAYYDVTSAKWYKDILLTQEVVSPTLDDIYFVAGAEGLVGADWAATDPKGEMTAKGDVFSVTYENIAAGKYAYKVLQDPADFGWDNAYTVESEGEKTSANGSIVVDNDGSTVTISINKNTKIVEVEVVEVSAPGEVETPPETTAPETTAPETIAEKNVTIKVTLDSSIAWEKVFLYAWNGGDNNEWPGVELVKDGDVYSVTIPVTHAKMNMIINNGDGEQTIDIEDIDVTGDAVEITVGAKNADGKYEATTPQAAAAPKTADSTNIALIIAVMAAMGCVVVATSKKKANR